MIDFIESSVKNRFSEIGLYKLIEEDSYKVEESLLEGDDPLRYVNVTSIPNNVWVFDNEYKDSRLSSGGSKIEKTMIFLKDDVLYLIPIELKSKIRTNDFKKKVLKKFYHSFDFIISHLFVFKHVLGNFNSVKIVPVCFYKDYMIAEPYKGNDVEDDNTCTKLNEAIKDNSTYANFHFESILFPEQKWFRVVIQSTDNANFFELGFDQMLSAYFGGE